MNNNILNKKDRLTEIDLANLRWLNKSKPTERKPVSCTYPRAASAHAYHKEAGWLKKFQAMRG